MDDYKNSDNFQGGAGCKMISPHHSHPTNGVRPSDFKESFRGPTMVATITKISSVSIRTIVHVARIAMLALVAGYLLFCVIDLIISPPGRIRFMLTFEDRPVPDISSYQALSLHGAGFDYHKNAHQEEVLYQWFARALLRSDLHMALTYGGYAQYLARHGSDHLLKRIFSHNRDVRILESELSQMVTELVINEQIRSHEIHSDGRRYDGVSLSHLTGVLSKVVPDGAPYPWALPKIKGKCYSKVVWDAAYWDLVSQHGSEDEKRHILSVEADYDWGRRLRVNGHVPSIDFEKIDIGFRLVFRDGVEGPVFARLDVKYPNAKGLFANDGLVYSSYDSIIRFVFAEMKKRENRGRTIKGRYESFDGADKVYVDGQDKPVLSAEISTRTMWQEYVDLQGAVDVPDAAYAKRHDLREVRFSSELKRIGACAFADCEMLGYGQERLRLPTGLESIGNGAFAGCSSIREVDIPATATNLGAWAFARCSALRHVTLPSGISEISDGLFYRKNNQSSLEDVTIPAKVRRIGKYAFASNVRLTEIELPESVEEIDDYAFYCCESLTNVVIKGKLKRVGEAAFWGCEKLKRPELPSSVEIGEEAFGGWIP